MKKNMTKMILLISIGLIVTVCGKEDDHFIQTDGYIVGFDPCAINHHYRIGYVIISTDLKDTLVTYNLSDVNFKMPSSVLLNPSDTLYIIPESYFQNFRNSAYFPIESRNEFKIKVKYKLATEEEKVFNLCTADINQGDFSYQFLNNQVIILTATKQ